jgi:hypothetical protein
MKPLLDFAAKSQLYVIKISSASTLTLLFLFAPHPSALFAVKESTDII